MLDKADTETEQIVPRIRRLDAQVTLPGSKSYTNRALALAGLAKGESVLRGSLFSDDTLFMAEALRQLGISVEANQSEKWFRVLGCAGTLPRARASVSIGNAGTAARFLTAVMSLGHGVYELDGVPRMRERPIGILLSALNALGGNVSSKSGNGCPPVRILAHGLRGGTVVLPGNVSSQYLTALLLIAPYTRMGITLKVEGDLVSKPYLDMTAQAMKCFGVELENTDYRQFRVQTGVQYQSSQYQVEPDASAASYFFAAAAITGGRVRIAGLGSESLQGDLKFVGVLEQMGCHVVQTKDATEVTGVPLLRGVEVNMADISDTAQTLAAVAPFATSPTRITGIGFIRKKETDRIAAMVQELNRTGIDAREEPDGVLIQPGLPRPARIETYDDHRMAMSFSLIGLRQPGIEILNPRCVSKTFPDFFEVLRSL